MRKIIPEQMQMGQIDIADIIEFDSRDEILAITLRFAALVCW
jgi:hypothetical protein